MLETNIDDMSPEVYSHLFPKLLDAGALDVFLTNIMMKKNRPGVKLSVLCREPDSGTLESIVFTETTTLGIRRIHVDRAELQRESIRVHTKYGLCTVKVGLQDGRPVKYAPEYEECSRIANDHQIPLRDVYQEIMQQAKEAI